MSWNPLGIYEPSKPSAQSAPTETREAGITDTRALAGGRLTNQSKYDIFVEALTLVAPSTAEEQWRFFNLDSKTLARLRPTRLLELLVDLSPDVSRALWDFLRVCNPGWEAKAKYPGTDRDHKRGQVALNSFLKLLADQYGAADIQLNRLFFSAFLRGAFFGELVLDEAGRMPVDFVTPDPCVVRFKKVRDEQRGLIDQAGQMIDGHWVAYDRPTIRYVPVDPLPSSSYGRPLASPAMFSTLFLLGMLHDLRRVIAQQGYPRLDLSVDLEKTIAAFTPEIKNDPKKLNAALAQVIGQITGYYSQLEPEDAYTHYDNITVNKPVGAVNMQSMGAIEGIIRALERFAVRALKTMPLLMGINEATSETHANRQWEIYIVGIKSIQHLCEQLLETLLSLALQAQGIPAVVKWRFAEVRAAEAMRDAEVEEKKIANAARKRDEGWITQDEAAQEVVKHKAVTPEPIVRAGTTPTSTPTTVEGETKRQAA